MLPTSRTRIPGNGKCGARAGLTLIEVLVVIAIIATLTSMALPAVQSAREGARRVQCSNNIKQIGLALHNYHEASGVFPPASIRDAFYENNGRDVPKGVWTIAVLPFLDAAPLYQRYDFESPSDVPRNASVVGTSMPLYLCPSDSEAASPFQPRLGTSYRRGNYGANFGTASWGVGDWQRSEFRGVMGQNASVALGTLTDGASQTVCVAELRIQPSARDNRGVWAFPAPGSASVGLDCDNRCRPINGAGHTDWIPFCDSVSDFQCTFQNDGDSNAGPRSRHPGGANLLYCDGSCRFVNENVAQAVLNASFTSCQRDIVGSE